MLNGRCYCGAVEYVVEDAFLYAAYCHCSKCRRFTGSAFSAFGGIEIDKLAVRTGAPELVKLWESPTGYDSFCRRCLSPLYSIVRERKYVHVRLGSLVDPPSRKPDHHIYVGSKAPWHEITDDLPQYDELPPG
jgi:hypothetical protein